MKIKSDQRGFAHLIIMVVVVIAVIGGVGYMVYSKQKETKSAPAAASAALTKAVQEAAKNCEDEDKDICKFYASWKVSQDYRVKSTDTTDGKTNVSTFESTDNGNKTYIKTEGEFALEVITIDKTTYTKAGDTWWKQTAKPVADVPKTPDATENFKYDFEAPVEDKAEAKTIYKKIGKEACGSLQCFRYQVIDPAANDTKQFIIFDDKDYQLRKMIMESADSKSEQTFEYSNVSIKVPSPVKELAANQYIIPGETEPATIPTFDTN